MGQKIKTKYTGVRYREHKTRNYGRAKDKYFFIRYSFYGKPKEEGVGWASEGWSAEKAHTVLSDIKASVKLGADGTSLREKRSTAKARKKAEQGKAYLKKSRNSTVREWGEKLLVFSRENQTEQNYKHEKRLCTKYIYPSLGNKPVHTLSEVDVQRFKSKISKMSPSTRLKKGAKKKKLAPRTVGHILLVLGKILKFAGVHDPPTSKVKAPKFDNKSQRYFTRDEIAVLFPVLKKKSQRVYDQAVLALRFGLRAKEVFNLRKMHLDFNSGAVRIVDSKNKAKNRTVYMTPESREVLKRNTEGKKPHELVFIPRSGDIQKQVNAVYYRTVAELGFNNGIDDRRFRADFHTLRHTYASWLIMSNKVSLYDLQKLLGHEDIKTTERYAHLAPERLKESAAVMAGMEGEEEPVESVVSRIA